MEILQFPDAEHMQKWLKAKKDAADMRRLLQLIRAAEKVTLSCKGGKGYFTLHSHITPNCEIFRTV